MSLSSIRIVLVNTSHPGNIGACARAMKTMGLTKLYLVQPKLFPSDEATVRAAGADDILLNASVCDSLEQALSGCVLVVGASARPRTIEWPELTPRACATQLVQGAAQGAVALVFGREHSGLSNEELDRCHYLTRIPANPAFASLNIAAAVQIFSYEILLAQSVSVSAQDEHTPVGVEQMELFYTHIEQVLVQIGFLNPLHPRKLMRRLRRLFGRARPDQNEINILRGMLTEIERKRSGGLG